jgi:hypothetical protein
MATGALYLSVSPAKLPSACAWRGHNGEKGVWRPCVLIARLLQDGDLAGMIEVMLNNTMQHVVHRVLFAGH